MQQSNSSAIDSNAPLVSPSPPSTTTSHLIATIECLPETDQLYVISQSFCQFASKYCDVNIEANCLELLLRATKHLSLCNRSNVIYKLAKTIGTMRPNGLDSRLPAKRMPMGLLEYMANFYDADNYQSVCPTF